MNYAKLIAMMAGAAAGGVPPAVDHYTGVMACGFECGQLGTDGHHWAPGTGASISTSTKRTGDRAFRVNVAAQTSNSVAIHAIGSMTVGRLYIRFATLPDADTVIIGTGSATGASRVAVGFKQSDSKLYCQIGISSPVLGATGVAVTTGVWYRIDFKFDQTVGAKTSDASVDGVALGQAASSSVAAVVTTLTIGSGSAVTGEWFYDDFVMSSTGADYPIGAGYVNHFVPVSDGTHSTGAAGTFITGSAGANITNATTTSYQLIDEVPLDDTTPDTNDYITQALNDATAYVEHVIGPAPGVSTPTEGPRGVEVIFGYHAASTGGGSHILKVNDNGTEDTVNSFATTGLTTTRYARKHYAVSPASGTNWHADNDGSSGDFRDLRTRFGYSADASPDQYLDCVMIEAEFSE